jgi:hypothetical protein
LSLEFPFLLAAAFPRAREGPGDAGGLEDGEESRSSAPAMFGETVGQVVRTAQGMPRVPVPFGEV